jgi:hypothetical protein
VRAARSGVMVTHFTVIGLGGSPNETCRSLRSIQLGRSSCVRAWSIWSSAYAATAAAPEHAWSNEQPVTEAPSRPTPPKLRDRAAWWAAELERQRRDAGGTWDEPIGAEPDQLIAMANQRATNLGLDCPITISAT